MKILEIFFIIPAIVLLTTPRERFSIGFEILAAMTIASLSEKKDADSCCALLCGAWSGWMKCRERQRGNRTLPSGWMGRSFTSIHTYQSSTVDSQAFTLIELLVVIAIIALLMAILLPTLARVRRQSRAVICRAQLKQWGQVFALYAEDHQGRLPWGAEDIVWILSARYISTSNPNDPKQYHPVRTDGIACCPTAVRPSGNNLTSTSTTGSGTGGVSYVVEWRNGATLAAWELINPGPLFRGSYGANTLLLSPRFYSPVLSPHMQRTNTDIFSLRGQGSIPLLLDSPAPSYPVFSEVATPPKKEPHPYRNGGEVCINRHDGTINGLFLDWSVASVGLKQLWTLKWYPGFNTANRWTKAGGVKPEDWPHWMRRFRDY